MLDTSPAGVPSPDVGPRSERRRQRLPGLPALAVLAATALLALPEAEAAEEARVLFGAARAPAMMAPEAVGSYAKGCLAGAVGLAETGPAWQAMRLSRNRNWGHPRAIGFVERLGAEAKAIGWPGIYVGDISQPRGGPALSGHRSHQTGLDVDVWLKRPRSLALSRGEREAISSDLVVADSRLDVNANWTPAHHALLKAAASDPEVARIFVNAAIKRALCRAEPEGAGRAWLRKIRPWWGHDSHFHVRLDCPGDSPTCIEQDPIPPGDGCDASLDWWFTDEALNPKPSGRGRELTMDDLPLACASVLAQ